METKLNSFSHLCKQTNSGEGEKRLHRPWTKCKRAEASMLAAGWMARMCWFLCRRYSQVHSEYTIWHKRHPGHGSFQQWQSTLIKNVWKWQQIEFITTLQARATKTEDRSFQQINKYSLNTDICHSTILDKRQTHNTRNGHKKSTQHRFRLNMIIQVWHMTTTGVK